MTSDAKRQLSTTMRSLRERLLTDLQSAMEATYRLSVRAQDAGLPEAARAKRARLEAWAQEQVRAQEGKARREAGAFLADARKRAAYTLLNRLVFLRLLEAAGLRRPSVVTGGWDSRAYKDFRQLASALVREDESEGYALLLQLVFDDLATDLPGLYGSAGVADLCPVPPATLRHVVDALNDPALSTCWTDDMTLGWVYQYWNDPEREALDAKLNSGGKVEPHEIASKTQMFTERYMVDWLLQNSLGPMWLAMCKKHGWTPLVESDGTLDRLEARRVEWRAKREAGEVELTALMPLHNDDERRWAYTVPQPIPQDAVTHAPDTVRDLKILDPAVGSGHFLVVAVDLLVALYREEAQHRGEVGQTRWSDTAIVERILSHNLHGIDLDPRAVQIAAAALWLKARQIAPDAHPERLNLVASNLRLASLPDDDPALADLRRQVEHETGVPGDLTDSVVRALHGADHLGSLLKVDQAVNDAIEGYEGRLGRAIGQTELFPSVVREQKWLPMQAEEARETILDRLEGFVARHTSGQDLGLRLRGEQLAAGVRFMRLVREGEYDVVVANPPYQGTSKMAESGYVTKHYKLGKADLYAAFLLRGLELVREAGTSAMLTMRNWMFIKQYAGLRERLLERFDLRALGDFDRGAFEDVPDEVVSVAVAVFAKQQHSSDSSALCPTPREDRSRDSERTQRKRAATLCHVGHHTFDPAALKVIPEWPLVYWWTAEHLEDFGSAPLLGDMSPAAQGLITGDNTRFLRFAWELDRSDLRAERRAKWAPYVPGGKGREWFEPLLVAVRWQWDGCEVEHLERKGKQASRPQNRPRYFERGVAFTMIGNDCRFRIHRYASVFGGKGSSVFPCDLVRVVTSGNTLKAGAILRSLNPGVGFEVGDVNRLPIFAVPSAVEIVKRLEEAFGDHEAGREASVEFVRPSASIWRSAREWAQRAVDRADGSALPPWAPAYEPEPPTDHLSYALGMALGRFPAPGHETTTGTLFLDQTLDPTDRRDGLRHSAAEPLHSAWREYGPRIDTKRPSLRAWLALDFFKDVHRKMYENRPIHWPLSSEKKTFVAWVNIHRWTEQTLRFLLADHLHPTLARLDGELNDLRAARDSADKKAARAAERRYDTVLKARDELLTFIADVEQCADKGPLPTEGRCPPREADARYAPDLDDGVMINAAALWKLLEPQWKDPKKWWKELASAKGKKDYDWSHLAMRYWPTRVDKKCKEDPSLGVAHGCFWKYHPARAWTWELRLQDEIGPDFRIEESSYRGDGGDPEHRAAYIAAHPAKALEAVEKEALRRRGRGKEAKPIPELRLLESGLWSTIPDRCWALETRIMERQEARFRLRAPDEKAARQRYESENPVQVTARRHLEAPFTDLYQEHDGGTA